VRQALDARPRRSRLGSLAPTPTDPRSAVYADTKPCQVCGAEVELRAHRPTDTGGVAEPDATVDERVCTNSDCPTRHGDGRP
jgi:hypothetical protein